MLLNIKDPNTKIELIMYIFGKKVVDKETGCWFTADCKDKNKYSSGNFRGHSTTLMRLTAAAFLDFDIYNNLKLMICHKCDIKACFNPDHLYIGTNGSNKKDWWDRQVKGLKTINKNDFVFGKDGNKIYLDLVSKSTAKDIADWLNEKNSVH